MATIIFLLLILGGVAAAIAAGLSGDDDTDCIEYVIGSTEEDPRVCTGGAP